MEMFGGPLCIFVQQYWAWRHLAVTMHFCKAILGIEMLGGHLAFWRIDMVG
jgi:hypothetical protein